MKKYALYRLGLSISSQVVKTEEECLQIRNTMLLNPFMHIAQYIYNWNNRKIHSIIHFQAFAVLPRRTAAPAPTVAPIKSAKKPTGNQRR